MSEDKLKSVTISFRIPQRDYTWLTQNSTNVSFFIRRLVEQAKLEEEGRPLNVRINETGELLNKQEKAILATRGNAWIDTPEVQAILRQQLMTLNRLKAKLAMLEELKA